MDASTYSQTSIEKIAHTTGYSTLQLFISIKNYFEEAKETPIKSNLDQLIPTLMKKQNQQKIYNSKVSRLNFNIHLTIVQINLVEYYL